MTTQPGLLTTWTDVQAFVFAGNATFTLRSVVTGTRFTYKVRRRKENPADDEVFFVNLLRGSDNEKDFSYMGVLRKPAKFFWTSASGKVGRQAPAYKALLWFLDALAVQRSLVLGTKLEVWHEGKCACCGRKLTVPESIASGWGPFCRLKEAA